MTAGAQPEIFRSLALYALGAALALAFGRRALGLWGGHLASALGGLAGLAVAIQCLVSGEVQRLVLGGPVPFATFALRLDSLAAFFLLIISLVGVAASLYAPGYLVGGHGSARGLGVALNLFLASMVLVVLADS